MSAATRIGKVKWMASAPAGRLRARVRARMTLPRRVLGGLTSVAIARRREQHMLDVHF